MGRSPGCSRIGKISAQSSPRWFKVLRSGNSGAFDMRKYVFNVTLSWKQGSIRDWSLLDICCFDSSFLLLSLVFSADDQCQQRTCCSHFYKNTRFYLRLSDISSTDHSTVSELLPITFLFSGFNAFKQISI